MGIKGKSEKGIAYGLALSLSLGMAMGCSEDKAVTEGVNTQHVETIRLRTFEDGSQAARAFVYDIDYVVIDSLVGPRFGDYIFEFLYKGNDAGIDSTDIYKSVYVPKDPAESPYKLFTVDGVAITD